MAMAMAVGGFWQSDQTLLPFWQRSRPRARNPSASKDLGRKDFARKPLQNGPQHGIIPRMNEDEYLDAAWEDAISGYDYEQEAYYDRDPYADRADYDLWEQNQVDQDREGYEDYEADEDSEDFS